MPPPDHTFRDRHAPRQIADESGLEAARFVATVDANGEGGQTERAARAASFHALTLGLSKDAYDPLIRRVIGMDRVPCVVS